MTECTFLGERFLELQIIVLLYIMVTQASYYIISLGVERCLGVCLC